MYVFRTMNLPNCARGRRRRRHDDDEEKYMRMEHVSAQTRAKTMCIYSSGRNGGDDVTEMGVDDGTTTTPTLSVCRSG